MDASTVSNQFAGVGVLLPEFEPQGLGQSRGDMKGLQGLKVEGLLEGGMSNGRDLQTVRAGVDVVEDQDIFTWGGRAHLHPIRPAPES